MSRKRQTNPRKIKARQQKLQNSGRGVLISYADLRDPAPMKNPRLQQAVLGRHIPAVRFASDNPVGSTDPDDLPPLPSGSSMADTDSPPWE